MTAATAFPADRAGSRFSSELSAARAALDELLTFAPGHLDYLLDKSRTAPPRGDFVVGEGILLEPPPVRGDRILMLRATFILRDSRDSPGYGLPYRAALVSYGERWDISAIESQCPSCFGSGVLYGPERPCDTCGAVGWGLREVLALTNEPAEEDASAGDLPVAT